MEKNCFSLLSVCSTIGQAWMCCEESLSDRLNGVSCGPGECEEPNTSD